VGCGVMPREPPIAESPLHIDPVRDADCILEDRGSLQPGGVACSS